MNDPGSNVPELLRVLCALAVASMRFAEPGERKNWLALRNLHSPGIPICHKTIHSGDKVTINQLQCGTILRGGGEPGPHDLPRRTRKITDDAETANANDQVAVNIERVGSQGGNNAC